MTMITPSYLGETIEYSSLHACRSTLEDPTQLGPLTQPKRAASAEIRRGSLLQLAEIEETGPQGPFHL